MLTANEIKTLPSNMAYPAGLSDLGNFTFSVEFRVKTFPKV